MTMIIIAGWSWAPHDMLSDDDFLLHWFFLGHYCAGAVAHSATVGRSFDLAGVCLATILGGMKSAGRCNATIRLAHPFHRRLLVSTFV